RRRATTVPRTTSPAASGSVASRITQMATQEHTAKAFDIDLQEITRLLAEMGGLAEKQIADSFDALVRGDAKLAQQVVATDIGIDALWHEIEGKAVLTIARRQPMAVDLRQIVGALRVISDLERIGDMAKNPGKRVIALQGDLPPPNLLRGVEHMGALVLIQLKGCSTATSAMTSRRHSQFGTATKRSTPCAPRCFASS